MQTIFDLGFHEGWDTDFYLRKGFRVVGVEANPELVARGRERFAEAIGRAQLVLIERAIAERADASVTFYCRADKNGWSSVHRAGAERDGITSNRVEVKTTSIGRLFSEYGVPHYLKCDIEESDEIVLQQLAKEPNKPRFVSFENGDKVIDLLVCAGYTCFQIINQGHLRLFHPPDPPREGLFAAQKFHGKMSGLFGAELDPDQWVGEAEIRERFELWRRLAAGEIGSVRRFALKRFGKLTRRTWLIPSGWVDIHARLDA